MSKSLRKILALILAMALMLAAVPTVTAAQANPYGASAITFENAAFKAAVLGQSSTLGVGLGISGEVTYDEAAAVTQLSVPSLGLSSLDDIRNFTGLVELDVSGNELMSLYLNELTELTYLDVSNNRIASKRYVFGLDKTKVTDANFIYGTQKATQIYFLNYDFNEGTGTKIDETANAQGATFTTAASTGITPPTGKQFKQWNTKADGTGTAYAAGATVTMPGADLTLYAIWETIPEVSEPEEPTEEPDDEPLPDPTPVPAPAPVTEETVKALTDLAADLTNATDTEIITEVAKFADEIEGILANDTYSALLADIEKAYVEKAGIKPSTDVAAAPAFLQAGASKIEVIGAAFNAAAKQTVELVVTTPEKTSVDTALAAVDTTAYNTDSMISLEINLEIAGVAATGTLTYPISITLPIPTGMKAADLRILHISAKGVEVITPKDNGDGTVTFTVSHFSTFAFVEVATVTPVTPPSTGSTTTSSSGGSGGGGGGAAAASNAPAPVTKANAVSLTKTAIASAAKAGTSAVVKFKNVSTLTLTNIKAMIAAAGKTSFTIQADSMTKNGKGVDVRIAFDPAKSTKDLNLSASTYNAHAVNTKAFFKSFYSNSLMSVCLGQEVSFGQPVKLAVKLDASLKTTTNLKFYSYNKTTNTYKLIAAPNYAVDANGYVHFTTELAGDIIISDGALAKK